MIGPSNSPTTLLIDILPRTTHPRGDTVNCRKAGLKVVGIAGASVSSITSYVGVGSWPSIYSYTRYAVNPDARDPIVKYVFIIGALRYTDSVVTPRCISSLYPGQAQMLEFWVVFLFWRLSSTAMLVFTTSSAVTASLGWPAAANHMPQSSGRCKR